MSIYFMLNLTISHLHRCYQRGILCASLFVEHLQRPQSSEVLCSSQFILYSLGLCCPLLKGKSDAKWIMLFKVIC